MATRQFKLSAEINAVIELDDVVFDVVDDEWRSMLYDLQTENEIIEHIAWNLLINRIRLSQMDGWADMPDSNAKIIDDINWYFVEVEKV